MTDIIPFLKEFANSLVSCLRKLLFHNPGMVKNMHRLGKLEYIFIQRMISIDEQNKNQDLDNEEGLKHCVHSYRNDALKTLED